MKHLISTCLAILAIALIAPRPASAAFLSINDSTAPEGSIIFNVGQFDRGVGFVLNGTTIMSPSEGTGSATVSEGPSPTSGGPITYNFTGQFATGGPLVSPTSGTIAFTEAGGGISDILTFSYTGGGTGGVATLTGSFVSDLDPSSLVAPPGATLVPETTAGFGFNNINILASAVSDVVETPEPGSLALLGGALLGFGLLRFRRKTG
jgi:hypothetical protein